MKNNTIVSLADSNYFNLLNELVDSILKFSESKEVDICILDAGLSIEQKNILSKKVKEIKKAQWDIDVPGYKAKYQEPFYQNIFQVIKSIYGSIVMHG